MKGFFNSFMYAFRGIAASFKEQRNIKIQAVAALVTVAAGFYFDITAFEWTIVVLTMGMVISLEMINTAIESVVDLVTQEWKPLAGKVKDIAAGAVLVASIMAMILAVIIFYKYLSP